MNTLAIRKLRAKLAADQAVYGLWVTLESPSITEMAVALGLDWVVIDAEHGHLDWKEIVEHLRATVRSDTVALVRVAELDRRADQAGARHRRRRRRHPVGRDGRAAPPGGRVRPLSAGGRARHRRRAGDVLGAVLGRAHGRGQRARARRADHRDRPRPRRRSPQMCQVDGVEIFFFGPGRFLVDRRLPRASGKGPGVAEQILAAQGHDPRGRQALRRHRDQHGEPRRAARAGLPHDRRRPRRRPAAAVAARVAGGGRPRPQDPSRASARRPQPPAATPLDRPPEIDAARSAGGDEPGRRAARSSRSTAAFASMCLVGQHNRAREPDDRHRHVRPGPALPCHTHPFSESITLLEGRLSVEVEGRGYALEPLDNVVIPPGSRTIARNLSDVEPAMLHIAMASDSPTRTLVDETFPRRPMPLTDTGSPGASGSTGSGPPRDSRRARTPSSSTSSTRPRARHRDERRLRPVPPRRPAAGPRPRLRRIDLHHRGRGHLRRRRPALHACGDCATALQPRGRVHYFINDVRWPDGDALGLRRPEPERIVVDERCATEEGNPWREGAHVMSEVPRRFRVALTGDFYAPDGSTKYPDLGLSVFDGQGHLEWVKLGEHRSPIGPDQLADAQGVIVLTPAVTAETVSRAATCWRSAGSASATTRSTWRPAPSPTSPSSSPPARSIARWPRRPSAG